MRAIIIGIAAAVGTWGIGVRDAAATCHSYQCGGNSPIIRGQPIANLNLAGAAYGGVRLRPDSLHTPRCPRGAAGGLRLQVRDGALQGEQAGRAVCTGRELISATFEIEVKPTGAAMQVVTLRIDDVAKVRTWLRVRGAKDIVPTFALTVVEAGDTLDVDDRSRRVALPPGTPLCSNRVTYEDWQDFDAAELEATSHDMAAGTMDPEVRPWNMPSTHALIVQGEAYDDEGAVAVGDGGAALRGAEWFNIACQGTGIAKMRLLGVDPIDTLPSTRTPLPAGATSATLKMLGARYDGHKAETKPGTPLVWTRVWDATDVRFFGRPKREDGADVEVGPIEAAWGANGALCLSHFRPPMQIGTHRLRGSGTRIAGATEVNNLRRRRGVIHLSECDAAALPAGTLWVTTTVDHPEHGLTLPDLYTVTGAGARPRVSGSAAISVSAAVSAQVPVVVPKVPVVTPKPPVIAPEPPAARP